MASIQIARDRDGSPQLGRYVMSAYVKTNFRDGTEEWRLADYLTPTRLSMRDFHGRSTATFQFTYGRLKQKDRTDLVNYYPRPDRGLYVCIMAQPPVPLATFCLWCGVIPAEQLRIVGRQIDPSSGDPLPAGVQILTAQGLEYLLERRGLYRAAVVAPGQDAEDATYFKQPNLVPSFNERLPRGTQRAGNRSQHPIKYAESPAPRPVTYGFGTDLDGAEPYRWSARQIVEYLLTWSDDYYDVGDNELEDEPHFVLGIAWPFALYSFFGGIYPTLRAEGRNVWEMLKEVIDRRRGVGASLVWSIDAAGWPDGTQDIELRLHSMTDTPLTVGGMTLPASRPPVDLVVDEDLDIDLVAVSIDEVLAYDKIVVQGNRVRSCFSAAIHKPTPDPPADPPDPPSIAEVANIAALTPAWTSADQTAYEAVPDAARRRERFSRVFRMFKLGHSDEAFGWFDWKTKGVESQHQLNPMFDDNGRIQIEEAGPYGNLGCRLLAELPIPKVSDVIAEVDEQCFFKPFALCEQLDDAGIGIERWITAHAPPDPGDTYDLEESLAAPRPDVSADVTPQDRGLEIDIHFRQGNHVLGKNHFTPAEGMEPKVDNVKLDYERMVVTVCAEVDNRPMVIAYTGVSNHFRSRVKTIILDDVHVWLVAHGTVTGVKDDGRPLVYIGPQVVRDDTDRLRIVAAMALAYHGRERAGLVLTRKGIRMDYQLGTYVRSVLLNLNLQPIGQPLAEIVFDFPAQTTTIRTGHAGLDFANK